MEFIVAYLKPFLVKSNRLLHAALVSVGLFKGFARGKMRANYTCGNWFMWRSCRCCSDGVELAAFIISLCAIQLLSRSSSTSKSNGIRFWAEVS